MTQRVHRIDRILFDASRDSGNKTFLLTLDGTEISYGAVFEQASRLAAVIVAAGIAPGERVLALLDNSRETIEFYTGCAIAGVIGVAVNSHSTAAEIASLMADCTPDGIVTQPRFLERLSAIAAVSELRLRLLIGQSAPGWLQWEPALAASPPLPLNADFTDDAAAIMIYSSGTTGQPKGILLSHRGVVLNALATIEALGYRTGDRSLTLLPLFSSFGFAFDFLHVAIMRNSTVLMAKFDEIAALDCIERFRVTFLGGVPTMFSRMFSAENVAGRNISSLRLMDVGGGPVSPRLKRTLKHDFGISVVESYGLTEISPVASVQRNSDNPDTESCGPALKGFEVRAVGPDGRELPPGEPGELLFRTPTFMLGYWNQPDLTAKTLRDGWLWTGDIGAIDEKGEIHIRDRTKDMIVSNGFNVFPKEVENVIVQIEGVRECAVVGIPDEIRGETISAFIVLRPGASLTAEAVIARCSEQLSRYKVPREIHFIDQMPLTASGKIRRHILRDCSANTHEA